METFLSSLFLFALFVAWPIYQGRQIASERNRSTGKATLLIIFFGWIGVVFLFLFLKTRREDGALI